MSSGGHEQQSSLVSMASEWGFEKFALRPLRLTRRKVPLCTGDGTNKVILDRRLFDWWHRGLPEAGDCITNDNIHDIRKLRCDQTE